MRALTLNLSGSLPAFIFQQSLHGVTHKPAGRLEPVEISGDLSRLQEREAGPFQDMKSRHCVGALLGRELKTLGSFVHEPNPLDLCLSLGGEVFARSVGAQVNAVAGPTFAVVDLSNPWPRFLYLRHTEQIYLSNVGQNWTNRIDFTCFYRQQSTSIEFNSNDSKRRP
jgi:hypothetical protein